MNLPTLISYAEFCFLGSNKRSHRVAASATRGWQDDSWPGAGFLYNSVPLDSVGWHGDSPPEAGFSTSKRASPVAHQSTPQEINQGLCFDVVVMLITEFGISQSELALQPRARGRETFGGWQLPSSALQRESETSARCRVVCGKEPLLARATH